jgi:hypothetical protein
MYFLMEMQPKNKGGQNGMLIKVATWLAIIHRNRRSGIRKNSVAYA